jgi:hypothetical protein
MDYYQGVVIEYLRADRAVFVNTEYLIQLKPGHNPDATGHYWYCDAVALDLQDNTAFLCETTFARPPATLLKRLTEWRENWDSVCAGIKRHSRLQDGWQFRVWIFVPTECLDSLVKKLGPFRTILRPKITTLEMVQPWRYHSWDHRDTADGKPSEIPEEMRA